MTDRCVSGKHAFPRPQEAWTVAERQTREHRGAVKAYRCHLCQRWHLTHAGSSRPQRKRRDRKAR